MRKGGTDGQVKRPTPTSGLQDISESSGHIYSGVGAAVCRLSQVQQAYRTRGKTISGVWQNGQLSGHCGSRSFSPSVSQSVAALRDFPNMTGKPVHDPPTLF